MTLVDSNTGVGSNCTRSAIMKCIYIGAVVLVHW